MREFLLARYERLPGDLRGWMVVKMGGKCVAAPAEPRERRDVVDPLYDKGVELGKHSPSKKNRADVWNLFTLLKNIGLRCEAYASLCFQCAEVPHVSPVVLRNVQRFHTSALFCSHAEGPERG